MRERTTLLLALALATFGCGNEQKVQPDTTAPLVSPLELPVSHRAQDPAPPGALRVDVGLAALHFEGRPLLTLNGSGRIQSEDQTRERLPKLASALQGPSAGHPVVLRVHANVPYETIVRVLHTLESAHVPEVAFEVRKSATNQAGLLSLAKYSVRPPTEEPIRFQGSAQRPWDDFASRWQEATEFCRRDARASCSPVPTRIVQGGDLMIVLRARGNGAKIEFRQFGVRDAGVRPEAAAPAEMIEGVPAAPSRVPQPAEDVREAGYMFRSQATTEPDSAISKTMRPVCGAHDCGVVVVADPLTPAVQVISFIGAAFPDGANPPEALFQLPRN